MSNSKEFQHSNFSKTKLLYKSSYSNNSSSVFTIMVRNISNMLGPAM